MNTAWTTDASWDLSNEFLLSFDLRLHEFDLLRFVIIDKDLGVA
jgi:hypothetical protein